MRRETEKDRLVTCVHALPLKLKCHHHEEGLKRFVDAYPLPRPAMYPGGAGFPKKSLVAPNMVGSLSKMIVRDKKTIASQRSSTFIQNWGRCSKKN
jgi:hypothetical protein